MLLPASVDPDASILHFVDHILTANRQTVFPVASNKQLFGMLVLEDLKLINRSKWNVTLVRDAMRPVTTDHFVETGTAIADATALAARNGCGAVGVIDDDGRL